MTRCGPDVSDIEIRSKDPRHTQIQSNPIQVPYRVSRESFELIFPG